MSPDNPWFLFLLCSVIGLYTTIFVLFNFGFGKAKLLYALFIHIERKPVINHNFSCFSIYVEFYAINSEFIVFANQEIISDSFTELHHLLLADLVFG